MVAVLLRLDGVGAEVAGLLLRCGGAYCLRKNED